MQKREPIFLSILQGLFVFLSRPYTSRPHQRSRKEIEKEEKPKENQSENALAKTKALLLPSHRQRPKKRGNVRTWGSFFFFILFPSLKAYPFSFYYSNNLSNPEKCSKHAAFPASEKKSAGLKKESRKKERKNLPLRNREKTLIRESDILPELFEKERKRREKKRAAEAGLFRLLQAVLSGRGEKKVWKRVGKEKRKKVYP